ncbi:MAG TPA: hypothetical protein PLW65_04535 [Pseudomonadota bacterium]|nr:hypothetical protein [Pseudomonadota bacterium]
MSSTPRTLAKNRQAYSAAARVEVGLEVGEWPKLERRLYVRLGRVELMGGEVCDVERKRAHALLARIGLEDEDFKYLCRAVDQLR